MASEKPVRLSVQAIIMSFTPRDCMSLKQESQKLAPSLLEIYIPNKSLYPSGLIPMILHVIWTKTNRKELQTKLREAS